MGSFRLRLQDDIERTAVIINEAPPTAGREESHAMQ